MSINFFDRMVWAAARYARQSVIAGVAIAAASWAYSAPPAVWNDRGCSSSGCHKSANLQSFKSTDGNTANDQLAGLTESNFVSRLLAANVAAMTKLADDVQEPGRNEDSVDRAAILPYLITVRDATVTDSLDLGTATIGSPAGAANVGNAVIVNERNRPILYDPPTFSANTGFAVTSQSCPVVAGQRAVAANSSCTITVQFQPAAPPDGNRIARLNLTMYGTGGDNAPPPTSVSLSGIAEAPVKPNMSLLTITSQAGMPQTESLVLKNIGTTAVTWLSLSAFSGSAKTEFSIDPDFSTGSTPRCVTGENLAGGDSCALPIRFDPSSTDQRDATLTLTYRLSDGSTQVNLPITLVGLSMLQGRLGSTTFTVTFDSTEINASREHSLQLSNIGTSPLTLTSLAGLQGSDFEQTSGTCRAQLILEVDAACDLVVTFKPSAIGPRSATLTVASNGLEPSVPISFSGTGAPSVPRLTLTPPAPQTTSLNFGSQTVGGLYPARVVRLTSSGTADVNIASITATSVVGATFAVTTPCLSTVAFGASCDIFVKFDPSAADTDFTGSLIVSSNAEKAPHVLPLTGRGVAFDVPVLAWVPAQDELSFGIVREGSISEVKSVWLQNIGPGGASISLINAVGSDASSFVVTVPPACSGGGILYQDAPPCRVDVQFAPTNSGPRTATVQVISSGSAPSQLTLSGTGMGGPTPSVAVSPSALDFGETVIGSRSQPLEVLIRSSGGAPLTVTRMAVDGAFIIEAGSCPAMPFTLQAGASCTAALLFAPQSEGPASGSLTLTTNASPSTHAVAMHGEGTPRPDLSSGGCSIASGHSVKDPTLWLLVALAIVVLTWRHRQARRPKGAR